MSVFRTLYPSCIKQIYTKEERKKIAEKVVEELKKNETNFIERAYRLIGTNPMTAIIGQLKAFLRINISPVSKREMAHGILDNIGTLRKELFEFKENEIQLRNNILTLECQIRNGFKFTIDDL